MTRGHGHLAWQDSVMGTASRMGVTLLCIHSTPVHPVAPTPFYHLALGGDTSRGTLVTAREHPAASPTPQMWQDPNPM